MCKLAKVSDVVIEENNVAANALMRNIREQLEKVINMGKVLSPDILMILEDIKDSGQTGRSGGIKFKSSCR